MVENIENLLNGVKRMFRRTRLVLFFDNRDNKLTIGASDTGDGRHLGGKTLTKR